MSRIDTVDVPRVLSAARSGSAAALGELLEGFRQYLLLIANQELQDDLRSKGGASDIVQEMFLEAQRDFRDFKGNTGQEVQAWLRSVLLSNLATFRRSFRRTEMRQLAREVRLAHEPLRSPDGLVALLSSDATAPAEAAIRQEERERVVQALGRLSAEHAQVLQLRHREQLMFREIGERMNRTRQAARMLWCRACERLACELDEPDRLR